MTNLTEWLQKMKCPFENCTLNQARLWQAEKVSSTSYCCMNLHNAILESLSFEISTI